MKMNDVTVHSIGGVNLDKDPRALKPNELSYANDNEVFGTTQGKDMSSYPYPSSVEIYDIPELTAQYQYVRAKFNASASDYEFEITDISGNSIGPATITISGPFTTVANFVTALDTILIPYGHRAVLGSSSGDWFSLAIYATGPTPIGYNLKQYEDGVLLLTYTLQEYFNPLGVTSGQFKPLQTIQVESVQFVFSKTLDSEGYQIGYAVPDQNGDWTYTSLIISRQFNFPDDKVIEIQGEKINDGQYALYWTDNTNKPKVLYIPSDLSTPLKYTMSSVATATDGLFSLESIDEQTNLQIQNYGRIAFSSQRQFGGALEAGTWFYYVQGGISRNYSEWSPASEPIPVFTVTTNAASAGALIGGDKTPAVTGKANVLTISGIDPKVYDTVRVAALLNQGGNFSALIVGEFDTPDDGEPMTVTHTCLETNSVDYDRALLPPVRDVILKAENLQIKKNILNLANIEKQVEEDLESVFANCTLGQTTSEMDSVGLINFTQDPVFRASLDNSYPQTAVGEQTVLLDNDTTNGNFDTGVYNIATRIFTVTTTGDYVIQIGDIDFGFSTDIGVVEVYVRNITTGDRYCLMTNAPTENFISSRPSFTQTVTLTALDELALKIVVKRIAGSSSDFRVISAFFTATKIISDYSQKDVNVGEYQLPENVATKAGYMVNEKYSFYGRILYASGYVSDWRHIGYYSFGAGSQFGLLEDVPLTDSTASVDTKVYAYGLTIDGIDVSTIKDRAVRIEIGRAICNPTILGTGMFIASDGSTGGQGGYFTAGLYTGNTNTGTDYGTVNNSTSNNRYFGIMLCPDWATGTIKPKYQTGDSLVVYGTPQASAPAPLAGGSNKWGRFIEFFGSFTPFSGSPNLIDVADADYCEWNTPSRVLRNDVPNLFKYANLDNAGNITTLSSEGMAMALGSRINPITSMLAFADYGVYYVQYYRPNANQYNPIDDTVVSCNKFIDISNASPDTLPQQTVYGGDTYTQKTYMKVMYNALNPDTTKSGTLTSFIGFYSQNKINQQMRFNDTQFTNQPFPFGNTLNNYLFGTYEAGEQFQIDAGYSWDNPLSYGRAYNPKLPRQSLFDARIIYSLQKVLNSLEDSYRVILPNNFKDLAAKDGAIHGLYDVNDVMVGLQEFKVSVLPYQSDVALSAEDGSIYVGNGGVYAQRENPISTYGLKIKSGAVVAENEAGNSVVYWFSNNGESLMRYGRDGVKSLSDENGWRSWFINNTNLVNENFDIVMGFDRYRRTIFLSTRAVNKSVPLWNSATAYTTGQYVRFAPINNNYQNFEQLPDVYRALSNNTNVNPFLNPATWQYISPDNTEYYNYNSVVYNEKANFFQGFFSLIVSRYFSYNGRIIVPRGRAPYNLVFDLFGSTDSYLNWLSDGGTSKEGSFVLEWVSNKDGVIPKRYLWLGLQVGTDHDGVHDNPDVSVSTETQVSQTVGGVEFEYLNGQLATGILPDNAEDPIISSYAKVRLTSGTFYRIYALAVHFYSKARTILK